MKFEEPEMIEIGLAADLTQIVYGWEMENPPMPQPCYDALSVCISESE